MSTRKMCIMIMAFILTIGLTWSSLVSADTIAQVNLEMEESYAKSSVIDLKQETELHVTVKNEGESQSWVRYTVILQKPFGVPGMPAMYLPETLKEDFIAPGKDEIFTITLKPGKYQLTLHSDEGNCKASGSIS